MDYNSINNHMSEQQKLSLSAAATQRMVDSTLTYDSINNCMSDQQKLSLMAANLQQMLGREPQTYDEINNKMTDQQKLSLIAAALDELKDRPAPTPTPTEDEPLSIKSYDPTTGKITGSGLGNTGTVYVLDRMQNKGVVTQVSNWSDSEITLATPIDTANLVGVTSLWVETPDEESNKIMVHGEQPVPGYGILYYDDAEGVVHTYNITTSTEFNSLAATASSGVQKKWTFGGVDVYSDQVVGFQIGEDATTTPQYFLSEMPRLNQPIDFSGLTSIGNSLMRNCFSFNQPIDVTGVTIGTYFLEFCYAFNQPIALETAVSFGSNFLKYDRSFNQPVKIPDTMTNVPESFLSGCDAFDSLVDLNNATSVSANFLNSCIAFNQPLDISKLTKVGSGFLSGCHSFDQPLDTSSITDVGFSFLEDCFAFDQSLNLNAVITMGNAFLRGARNFNQPVSLPNCTTIGNDFLRRAASFKSRVTLGAATSVSGYFMAEIPTANTVDVGTSSSPTDTYSFCPQPASSSNKYYSAIGYGFTLIGANASAWKAALPDKTSYPARTIIDGTV